MEWVSRVLETVAQDNLHLEIDWNAIEHELGTRLPDDFKELAESIGVGEFSEYLYVDTSDKLDDFSVLGDLASIRRALERRPVAVRVYEPYQIFTPGEVGLLPWGRAVQEGVEFYWLAGGENPSQWPILARLDPSEEWYRFDMTVSEFVFRMLTGDEKVSPFRIPEVMGPPRYEVY
ncbi:SMI1/KNR4 family protein [Streptomyces sp. NPDC002928]|uniref:SMI1/KNR4 family protein n=1 Tax=Streptomyces sp. NPDC002928 TaxID=3154440 RepID=UPI0033B48403